MHELSTLADNLLELIILSTYEVFRLKSSPARSMPLGVFLEAEPFPPEI